MHSGVCKTVLHNNFLEPLGFMALSFVLQFVPNKDKGL